VPRLVKIFVVLCALLGGLGCAQAGIVVTVDKSSQRLSVVVDGQHRYDWPVSTARMGYNTPNGTYRPERLARQWYSSKYDWSPMPYSIFFHGGYAIHGSYEVSRLGRPASHGCIRLLPANAAILYGLVQNHTAETRIVVTGDGAAPLARSVEPRAPRHARNDSLPRHRRYGRDFEEIFYSGEPGYTRWR